MKCARRKAWKNYRCHHHHHRRRRRHRHRRRRRRHRQALREWPKIIYWKRPQFFFIHLEEVQPPHTLVENIRV